MLKDEDESYPLVYEAKGAIALLYQVLLYMLISVIPAAFLYFFLSIKLSPQLYRLILIALSSSSFVTLTIFLKDAYQLNLWFLIIPIYFIGLYAGTSSLIISASITLILQSVLQTPSVMVLQCAVIFAIGIIINKLSYASYHSAQSSKKYWIIMRNNVVLVVVVVCLMLININWSSLLSSWGLSLELIGSLVIQVLALLASFIAVNRQNEHIRMSSLYTQMRESANRELHSWMQVVRNVPISILSVDRFGAVLYANAAAHAQFPALKKNDDDKLMFGQQLVQIVSEKANQLLAHSIQQVLLSKKSVNVTDFNGEKHILYSITPLEDYSLNESHIFTIFVQDVTELQTLRSEIDRMDRLSLVGQMAAGITHEIRNPMAVIRGFVQLLQEKGSSLQQEYFRIIIDELDRANSIITDFLALAQNKEVMMESHSINEIIHEVAPLLMADANLRGQTLSFSLANNIPFIELNDREIKQLLLNLARNGMEAMEADGHLEIYTYKSNQSIHLCIADNGPGIPDEIKKKIFEPFYTSKSTGTGLGLSLCASIIKRHNGQVHLLNRDTMGTIVQVTFPIEQQLMTS